jgi:hypothetical protein
LVGTFLLAIYSERMVVVVLSSATFFPDRVAKQQGAEDKPATKKHARSDKQVME